MSDANDQPNPGCEFCSHEFNRPDSNEPFDCPYCGQRWIGAKSVDPQSDDSESR